MIKILFVCHGNICRSPMAEMIFRKLCEERGFPCVIDSAATSTEEIGNPVYPPAKAKLRAEGVPCLDHRARRLTREEYHEWDRIIVMDDWNLRNISRFICRDPEGKIRKLLDYTGEGRDVADPWYSGDFDTAYSDILRGCEALLRDLTEG